MSGPTEKAGAELGYLLLFAVFLVFLAASPALVILAWKAAL